MTGPAPNARSRPGEEAAPVQTVPTKTYREGTTGTTAEDEAHRWALTMIGQLSADPLPLFASPDWCRSPGPVRLASALRAALAWHRDSDAHTLAARLDLELQAAWRHDEMDYDRWREVAAQVRRLPSQPDAVELQRRRAS